MLRPEITLFPGDKKTFHLDAWMNAEPLTEFRTWAGRVPGAAVHLAVVGVVFYEFTFAKGHHQTGMIYGLRKIQPYHPDYRPGYATYPKDFPITNSRGAFHLEGIIEDVTVETGFEGSGAID